MTKDIELREQIKVLDEEISRWNYLYKRLREDLDHADQQIMSLHRKKWKLELLLIPTQVIPTRKTKTRKINTEVEFIDIDKLSQAQIAGLMAMLQAQGQDTEIEIEQEEEETDNEEV